MKHESVPQSGCVVRIEKLPDPQGENIKNRRCVVLDKTNCGRFVVLVSAASKFDAENLADDEILIRKSDQQQPSLWSFDTQTAVKCSWLAVVNVSDCEFVSGPLPPSLFNAILENVKRLRISNRTLWFAMICTRHWALHRIK